MLAAIVGTTIAAVWMVRALAQVNRYVPPSTSISSTTAASATTVVQSVLPGVRARLTPINSSAAHDSTEQIVIERRLPTMSFALQPGESLDSRIAPGPFKAEFEVPFYPGATREAQLGVEFQGGKVIVTRNGEIILSDAAGEPPRTALSNLPVRLLRDQDSISITFESDGQQPCRVRAIWKPEEAMVPLPLPAVPTAMLADDATRGLALVQQFNCAACHVSADSALQVMLMANPGPVLGDVGARIRPDWITHWLSDPQSIKPGALMPTFELDRETIENLTQFLASMGGPISPSLETSSADLANTGMVVYHTVGCFACHGALEKIDALPGGHPTSTLQALKTYESMGRPSQKTSADALAEFLVDPVRRWPSGRMPSLNLQPLEAQAIAAYLISRDRAAGSLGESSPFALDSARVESGKTAFASTGCANCHTLGPDRPAITTTLAARPLESLINSSESSPAGCLAADAGGRSPHFTLSASQRRAIEAFLRTIPHRKTSSVPLDHLAVTTARLNCTNCHAFHGDKGPEAAIAQYFSAIEEADLGDEGREPPNLSDVGGKLNPQWFHDVLTAAGRARPYLGARMPQFGETNVDQLPQLFSRAAGVWPTPDQGPALPSDYGEVGRQLVGAKAMNCIQCHNVAGRASTGTPGPDLAQMAERLRYDAFSRWIHDPKLTRPGTRMPSFFLNGLSGFTDLLGGDADKQVDAIWAYLSLGEFMPLPDGLVDASSLTLLVKNEPMIFRSFIKGAGVRAIAVGYPEQIHLAFDASKCLVAEAWEGEFLNAAGAWANRGGTETNPRGGAVKWTAPKDPLFVSASVAGGPSSEIVPKFRGYRLDDQRRPTFVYELRAGEIEVLVNEQPLPSRSEGLARMTQRFALEGPKGAKVILAPGKRTVKGLPGDASDGVTSVTLDDQGKAEFELEVTW